MRMRTTWFIAAAALALASVACGKNELPSPTAPTVSAPSAEALAVPVASNAGATIDGLVFDGIAGASSEWRVASGTTGLTVTVAGSKLTATVDGGGRFVLKGVPSGRVELVFSGSGTEARVTLDDVADFEEIHITVRVSGTSAELDEKKREAGDKVEIEGKIAAINPAVRSLKVGNTDVMVPAGTPIRHGSSEVALADLSVGDRVHVKGTKTGTTVTASSISAQTKPKEDDFETEGGASDISGTCPAITFRLGSLRVTATASTQFEGQGCSGIADGIRVKVKGRKQTDGSVSASRVKVEKKEEKKADTSYEVTGTVSGKSGTCPSITFTVSSSSAKTGTTSSSKTVKTNSATSFHETTCAALASGDQVEVKGAKESDGAVLAASVQKKEKKEEQKESSYEVTGSVSGKSGSCPSITFTVSWSSSHTGTTVSSKTVKTSASTSFLETTCASLAAGEWVYVKGTKQSDGTLLAASVQKKK